MVTHDQNEETLPNFDSDVEFGEWFHRRLEKQYGFDGPRKQARRKRGGKVTPQKSSADWERIRRVEERLQASFPPAIRRKVEIVRMKEVNAFVVPGRYIYITDSLLKQLPSDDAAALVIGHELAHAELGHLLEFRRRTVWKDIPAGDIAFFLLYLVQRFVSSPENERDADAYGLDLAMAAGYDGERCQEAFQILEDYMLSVRGAEPLVVGPDAARRRSDDEFDEWKARAELWLWERMTGYPALRDRRAALADRFAQHQDSGRAPLLLPGSHKSTASVTAGYLARVEAIDAELDNLSTELTALGSGLADLMRLPTYRRLVESINGTATGLDGRTLREAEPALANLSEAARQTTTLLSLQERAREIRRFLSSDNPPMSALAELQSLLFGLDSPNAGGQESGQGAASRGVERKTTATPRGLASELAKVLRTGQELVGKVDSIWADWRPRMAEFRDDLYLLRQACQTVAADQIEVVDDLAKRIDALERRIHADPLNIGPDADKELRRDIEAARQQMLAMVMQRRGTGSGN
jgi:hypothetical protein